MFGPCEDATVMPNGRQVQICRMPFLEGLAWGLATALLLGPVFFTLLRASLEHGFRGGALVAVGIILSDILAMLICASGAHALLGRPINEQGLALIGAVLLLAFGSIYLIKRPREGMSSGPMRKRDALGLVTSGFLVNFVNPFVFAVWAGLVLHGTTAYGVGNGRWLFFVAVLLGIFSSDLMKAWLAPRLARFLSNKVIMVVQRTIGAVLVLSSARLFWMAAE